MNDEHECRTQQYRIAKYGEMSGGGWFLEARFGQKIDIKYCPYCGDKLKLPR